MWVDIMNDANAVTCINIIAWKNKWEPESVRPSWDDQYMVFCVFWEEQKQNRKKTRKRDAIGFCADMFASALQLKGVWTSFREYGRARNMQLQGRTVRFSSLQPASKKILRVKRVGMPLVS